MVHEQALEILQEHMWVNSAEIQKTIRLRIDTMRELDTTTFNGRKSVLTDVINGLWEKEQEIYARNLNLAASVIALEDAQDREEAKHG